MALLCYKCEGFGVNRNFLLVLQGGLPLGSVPLGREGAGGRRQPICFVRGGCPKRKTKQKGEGSASAEKKFWGGVPQGGVPLGRVLLGGEGDGGRSPKEGSPSGEDPLGREEGGS